ncbi:hypothetical protein [Phormidium pseudopriestleyi]|nr:hypothetical protein [Phormidium pseudopriestleyi]
MENLTHLRYNHPKPVRLPTHLDYNVKLKGIFQFDIGLSQAKALMPDSLEANQLMFNPTHQQKRRSAKPGAISLVYDR